MREFLGLGIQPKDLDLLQVAIRGVIVFMVTLLMVRVADKRFLSKMSALDVILGFILASMLARAVNGSAAFFPTLAGGFVLVFLHRLLGIGAFHSERFGRLIKGQADVLVHGGKPDHTKMRKNRITRDDLLEEARLNGKVASVAEIKTATIERNGKISILPEDSSGG